MDLGRSTLFIESYILDIWLVNWDFLGFCSYFLFISFYWVFRNLVKKGFGMGYLGQVF